MQNLKATISDLDELVSKLKIAARHPENLTDVERETLRHHAKDMIGAGTHYLLKLGEPEDVMQMQKAMTQAMLENDKKAKAK